MSEVPTSVPNSGLRQLAMLLSLDPLAQPAADGRFQPKLAESWTVGDNGRKLTVRLKPGIRFQDGSPADAQSVASILADALRTTELGALFNDVDHIGVADSRSIDIGFRRASPLLLELLWVQIRKPGPAIVGTGPFVAAQDNMKMRANPLFHLGHPRIEQIRFEIFPTVRKAWAELLRDRLDMIYDVGPDELDSLGGTNDIHVFTFIRGYQYVVLLNGGAPPLRSTAVRRALNMAVDRRRLVQLALDGHGVPSTGLLRPEYWALDRQPALEPNPHDAAAMLSGRHLRFTCLVPPDRIYERIALELKRQLFEVGVQMDPRSASLDEIFTAVRNGSYEAVLFETGGGRNVLRPYQFWHSGGVVNPGQVGNHTIEAAFDRVRDAGSENEYRRSVGDLQRAFNDDPPALFLAWSERARAVSKRFAVVADPGRDVLGTMYLWRPRSDLAPVETSQ